MSHILKNKLLEIHIDEPLENYNFSRFDWSGKISKLSFKGITLTTTERTDDVDQNQFGQALYNEFGIEGALGFQEAEQGDWFHKIGIGLLKKDTKNYDFMHYYKVKPAQFSVTKEMDSINLKCNSDFYLGYAYRLNKKIELLENGFKIFYELINTGEKEIHTSEYVHNFLGFNKDPMNPSYILNFPFDIDQNTFNESVNTEGKIKVNRNGFGFKDIPIDQFFFSNISGNNSVNASWELLHKKLKISLKESTNFKTNKINLWGWQHVISPELFHTIHLKPNESTSWERTYAIRSI
ncbi:MAG: hypothetical protein ACWA5P_07425 [bacterium]